MWLFQDKKVGGFDKCLGILQKKPVPAGVSVMKQKKVVILLQKLNFCLTDFTNDLLLTREETSNFLNDELGKKKAVSLVTSNSSWVLFIIFFHFGWLVLQLYFQYHKIMLCFLKIIDLRLICPRCHAWPFYNQQWQDERIYYQS